MPDPEPSEHDSHEGGLIKPFLEHLEELRWMLVKCMVTITVMMGVCLGFVREILRILEFPLIWSGLCKDTDPSKFLISYGVADSFTIAFKVGILGGLIFSIPLILYFIG